MPRKFTTSYDELIRNYYGNPGRAGLKDSVSVEELFANYYGNASVGAEERKKSQPAQVMSLPHDTGEVLRQRRGRARRRYGYQQSADANGFEEYVVTSGVATTQSVRAMSVDTPPVNTPSVDTPNVNEEYVIDILAPLPESSKASPRPITEVDGSAAAPAPAVRENPAHDVAREEFSRAKVTDDDILSDLEAIIKGEKAYDQSTKKMVAKDPLSAAQSIAGGPPAPQAGDGQAIFDRIAQSMSYANAYDMGTVELENRFADFDRLGELQQKSEQVKKKKSEYAQTYSVAPAPSVKSADFIEDLDAIRRQQERGRPSGSIVEAMSAAAVEEMKQSDRDPVCRPWALSLSAGDDPASYSRPLFESGEHALTGWDLYTDQLKVGQEPGVMFSYGDLIAMGDLYQDVKQMMAAPVAELRAVKNSLSYDRRYYDGRRVDKSLKVLDDNWENIVGSRYIDLAEDNYAHFAPNYLFPNEPWSSNCGLRDNKISWRHHHLLAINEAQKIRQSAGSGATPFLERALIINAFGDHFLTDAFSAGHTISKEATVEMFKYNFYDGKALKPAAEKFLERVAEKAFYGKVKDKFSVLETYDPVIPGIGVGHPNFDTVGMFTRLLKGIAEQAPDQIANLVVLILHDDLNKQGVMVTNDFVTKPWRLTGDGLLDYDNLQIIKKAVQQSVDNVNDPANNGSNFQAAVERVWRHVPRLTDAAKDLVKNLSREYTNPSSDKLVTQAAAKIHERVDLLIKKLLAGKQLRYESAEAEAAARGGQKSK